MSAMLWQVLVRQLFKVYYKLVFPIRFINRVQVNIIDHGINLYKVIKLYKITDFTHTTHSHKGPEVDKQMNK